VSDGAEGGRPEGVIFVSYFVSKGDREGSDAQGFVLLAANDSEGTACGGSACSGSGQDCGGIGFVSGCGFVVVDGSKRPDEGADESEGDSKRPWFNSSGVGRD
jgi:hypothetical protein